MDYMKLIQEVAKVLTGCDDAVQVMHQHSDSGTVRIALPCHKWAGILIRYGHYNAKGKLTASINQDRLLSIGKYHFNQHAHPEIVLAKAINIAVTKTPEQIAREINRRLLPNFVDYLHIMEQVVADTDARNDHQFKQRIELGKVLGEKQLPKSADESLHRYDYDKDGAHIRGAVRYDGRVSLELDYLPFEKAKQILGILIEKGAA